MRPVIALTIALTLFAAVLANRSPGKAAGDEAVLTVGSRRFSASDVELRRRIVLQKYGDAGRAVLGAYAQLIEGYLLVEVLAGMGHPITEEDLDREIERIDRNTHDPEGLARLKAVCGGGKTAAYRRIAILPDFANRRFYYEVHSAFAPQATADKPKPDADEVFWARAGKIPVRVADPAIQALLKTKVSWAGRVNFE